MNDKLFAVKAVVKNKDKILVLIKSENEAKNDGGTSGFDLPGGRVLENESFIDAVKREIAEETKLCVYDIRKIFENTASKPNGKVLNFIYYGCIANNINVKLSTEHKGYLWKSKEEILCDSAFPKWIKDAVKKYI